jgi:DNA-binding winged helix-turn-helix (wHTH) protein/TolB-like protein
MNAGESPISVDLAREADFRIGALEVRPSTREVVAGEAREVLEPRVMQVLTALARRRGEVVSRDELTAACWGGRVVGDDAIQRAVAVVRRLGEAHGAFSVETVARVGYRLSEPGAAPGRPKRRTPTRGVVAAALAVLVGVAAAGAWYVMSRAPPPARVAVLPFTVEGADPALQGFADGLLDETIGAISSDHVQAVSRSDSRAMRGPDAEGTAKRLGVGLFLDGAVSKVGDNLKVRLYLNDAHDHTTLWSKDFERPAAEADAMQSQVAARAADVAHTALIARAEAGPDVEASVVGDFVEATDEMSNGGGKGDVLMRRVIAKAPRFSHAYSLLAMSAEAAPGESEAELFARQRALARRALQLNPHNGEAWLMLASIARMGDWSARDDALERGTRAEPAFAPVFHLQSRFFGQVGRFQDAITAGKRASAVNDKFSGAGIDPCIRLDLVGRFEEARPVCERADRLWPDVSQLQQFIIDLETGQDVKALERLQQGPHLRGLFGADNTEALTTFLRARVSGDAAGARAAAVAAGRAADAGKVDRRVAYIELATTNQVEAALSQGLRWFTPALAQTEPWDFFDSTLLFAPATASVRRDPRFMAIPAQFKLADYWRTSGKWPDFCSQPGLPYDCKVEAAKLAKVAAK